METYRIVFNEDKVEGVYAISLVEDPAIEVEFVALSKEKIQLKEVNEEKRLLISPVLIPNQKILRLTDEGVPYNIVFEEETIRKVQQNFYKKGYQNNSTLEHNENLKLSDVTFVESWIKEDEQLDKSVKYGFSDLPVGTWFAIMKVENDEVWEKVKSGEVKGFSIDGAFELESINLNVIKMSIKKEVLQALKNLGITKLKFGSVETEQGTIYFEGEELAEGVAVFADAEMTTPLADGSYNVNGQEVVVSGGMITSMVAITEMSEEAVEEIVNEEETLIDEIASIINEETPEDVTAEDSLTIAEDVVEKIIEIIEEAESVEELKAKLKKSKRKVAMRKDARLQKLLKSFALNSAKEMANIQDELKAVKTELAKAKQVEAVQMTKANPIHETKTEPKTLKEKMLNNLKNAK
jgi:hypothetical protein